MADILRLKVAQVPNSGLAIENCAIINPEDLKLLGRSPRKGKSQYIEVLLKTKIVYTVLANKLVKKDSIGLNGVQRKGLRLALKDNISISPFVPSGKSHYISSLSFGIRFYNKNYETTDPFQIKDLQKSIRRYETHFFTVGQTVLLDVFFNSLLSNRSKSNGDRHQRSKREVC